MKTKSSIKDKLLFVVAVILVLISLIKVGIETYESLFNKPSEAQKPLIATEFMEQTESLTAAFNNYRKVGESSDI